MKSCNDCTHVYVCDDILTSACQATGECDYFENESQYKHTLRLIYADFIAAARKRRHDADTSSKRGDAMRASDLIRRAEDRESAAVRVRFYCRRVGFDPAREKPAEEGSNHERV